MTSRCINQLKADHQLILQALEVLREMTERLENYSDVDREDVLELLTFFDAFAHDYHDAKEQFLLIPAMAEGGVSLQDGPLKQIMSDHCNIYAAIEKLKLAIVRREDTDFVELSNKYSELLTTHIFNEDRVLFDWIEQTLTPERDNELIQAFEAFEPNLRDHSRRKYDRIVRALGRKYLVPRCV